MEGEKKKPNGWEKRMDEIVGGIKKRVNYSDYPCDLFLLH